MSDYQKRKRRAAVGLHETPASGPMTGAAPLLVRGGIKFANPGGSSFYSPAVKISESLAEAMDPRNAPAPVTVVVETPTPERAVASDGTQIFSYRCVVRRTEKAVLVSMGGRNIWLPKSRIEFLPGCRVRMPTSTAVGARLLGRLAPRKTGR